MARSAKRKAVANISGAGGSKGAGGASDMTSYLSLSGDRSLVAHTARALSESRLGTVLRFTPGAKAAGIKQLETGGFKVASSRDFGAASAVPSDFGGADVQYFERFGVAVVRGKRDRLRPRLCENAKSARVFGGRFGIPEGSIVEYRAI